MRPKKQTLSAAGNAPWIPVNQRGENYGIGIGVAFSDGATLTCSIQHSFDDPNLKVSCTIARVTTTATVTFASPHGMVVGDSINIVGCREANLSGVFAVASVPSTTTLTYTVSDTGATAVSAQAVLFTVFNNDDLTGLAASADGGYVLPPSVMRLAVTAYTDGIVVANFIPLYG